MSPTRVVDVNADVGEGGEDEQLMPYLSSVSIACGGHAGDAESVAAALTAARRHGLLTGAHVSYPDREGFGRRELDIPAADLTLELIGQLQMIGSVAAQVGATISHVKAHGALYNRAWYDQGTAALVARAVVAFNPELALFCPPGSAQEAAGERAGLAVVREVFADRRYAEDGSGLLPRDVAGAVIADADDLPGQLAGLAPLEFDTICIHSDNPKAAELLKALGPAMADAGWERGAYPLP